jgi:signal transduction histidine kinase
MVFSRTHVSTRADCSTRGGSRSAILNRRMIPRLSTGRIVTASAVAALGLVIVGWIDYAGTRQELLRLLRDQAASLRQTIAAAARANEAAGAQAEAQMTERLLDNARLLAEVDRRGGLTQQYLDGVATKNRLFRAVVFAADGSRQLSSSGAGRFGQGRAFQSGSIVQRLVAGTETEVVEQMHPTRWGGSTRIAAGVRRANGGAIVLNVDASDIEALQRQVSLDSLIRDIAATTAAVAFVSLEGGDVRVSHGDLPPTGPSGAVGAPVPDDGATPAVEREVTVGGRPVLEFSGPITLGSDTIGRVRLGLRLDDLRHAERRVLLRLVVSLAAALLLSLLALGTVWLRQAYTALSEKHALAEAALRRRDRLSAMGELASTVAHEVRNPLNAIAMSSQRLRREFLDAAAATPGADRAELEQLLGVLEGETRRINDIVQQFLAFARPPKLAPRTIDLAAHVHAAVEAMRPVASRRSVSLETDVAGARQALVDPDQLRTALDNLIGNAIEATPAGGRVRVTARSDTREHVVEVSDTGAGIAADDLPRIFDLYFTTKAEGTGIGLAVTQQIVSAHGGTIEVDSTPGAGTRMTVRLPTTAVEAAGV